MLVALTCAAVIITAAVIWLEDRSPIFYSQERVGLDGHTFKVLKFRSMRNDAEKGGAQWSSSNDARVTRVGAFIRRLAVLSA